MKTRAKVVLLRDYVAIQDRARTTTGINGGWWLLALCVSVSLWALIAWGLSGPAQALH